MLNLRALTDFARDLAAAIRPAPRTEPDDLTAVARAAGVFLDDYGYRAGRAATSADLAYHELMSEVVLDAANERWQECGGVLPESWLLLDVEVEQ